MRGEGSGSEDKRVKARSGPGAELTAATLLWIGTGLASIFTSFKEMELVKILARGRRESGMGEGFGESVELRAGCLKRIGM